MEKSAKAVADHSAYSEAYQKAVDWLSATEEQLKTISDSRWESLEAVMHELNLIKVQPFTFHRLAALLLLDMGYYLPLF